MTIRALQRSVVETCTAKDMQEVWTRHFPAAPSPLSEEDAETYLETLNSLIGGIREGLEGDNNVLMLDCATSMIFHILAMTAHMGIDIEPFWIAKVRFIRGEPLTTENERDLDTEFDRILQELKR